MVTTISYEIVPSSIHEEGDDGFDGEDGHEGILRIVCHTRDI